MGVTKERIRQLEARAMAALFEAVAHKSMSRRQTKSVKLRYRLVAILIKFEIGLLKRQVKSGWHSRLPRFFLVRRAFISRVCILLLPESQCKSLFCNKLQCG